MFIGTGTTVSFDSGFFAEILDVSPPNATRNSVETSHMGTTNSHTFTPTDLVDWGELNIEMAFDPEEAPPVNAAAETVVITFSDSGATTWTFTAFMTNYEPSVPLEDRATATATLKVSGSVAIA